MKSACSVSSVNAAASLPARVAWIEIHGIPLEKTPHVTSLPARVAWIEIFPIKVIAFRTKSLPARVAWIEIMRVETSTA